MKVDKKRTNFGHIDDSTTPVSIDPDLAAEYSDQVVQYAELLKGQHNDPDTYTDAFFLEYASRMVGTMRMSRMTSSTTLLNPCPDPRFAEYSYEEIINMAQNGFVVPDEVLQWALAQQGADISDYIVISDEVETDDNSSTDTVTNESDITQLRKLAKEYIAKSAKYQDMLDQDNTEMDDLTKQVNSIVAEQEQNAESLDDLTNLINKWKNLDKKSKNGDLSVAERDIYKDLSNQINSSKKTLDDIETSKEDLDQFLGSIKDLRIETDEALVVAQETLDASYNLSNLEQQINPLIRTQAPTFVGTITAGMLSNILAELTDDTISYVAEQTGKNLQTTGNNIISDLTGSEKKELQEFAFDYSTRARELIIFVNNNFDEEGNLVLSEGEGELEGESGSGSLASNVNKMFEKNKSVDASEFGFLLPYIAMPQTAVVATAATLVSSAVVTAQAFVLKNDTNKLNKQIKEGEKENKKLEGIAKEIGAKYKANNEKIEEDDKKIIKLNEDLETGDNPEEIINDGDTVTEEKETLENENKIMKASVEKPFAMSSKILAKNRNDVAAIRAKGGDLKTSVGELNQLSKNTLVTGTANVTTGVYNGILSLLALARGTALMASLNPVAVARGAFLIALGTKWAAIAATQMAAGPLAIGSSVVGYTGALLADTQTKSSKEVEKNGDASNKTTVELIKETMNNINDLEPPVTEGEPDDSSDNPPPPEDGDNPPQPLNGEPLRLPAQNSSAQILEFVPVSGNFANISTSLPLNNLPTSSAPQMSNLLSSVSQDNLIIPTAQNQQNQSQIILQSDNNRSAAATSFMLGSGNFAPDNGNRMLNRFQKDLIIESKRKSRIVTGASSTSDRQGNYY